MRGFTLIELVVVFSIIAIISTIGIISFSNYNKIQQLNQAVSDTVNLLNSAKSNSLSQIKPEACDPTYELYGYRITAFPRPSGEQSTVKLETICRDPNNIIVECATPACKNPKTLTFLKNIKITNSTDEIFFYPLSLFEDESVDGGSICVEGWGIKKEISVSNLG